jgi:hypothetical protein
MTFFLSHEPDRFSLLLEQSTWLEPAVFAPKLASILRLPKADAVRMCRLQRGVLFQGAAKDAAEAAAAMLQDSEVPCLVLPDSDVPVLPQPIVVSVASVLEEGLDTPSVKGVGLPRLWKWDDLAMLSAGIILDEAHQTASMLDRAGEEALQEEDDRKALAQGALQRARQRVFPLTAELAEEDPLVAEALSAALRGQGTEPREVPGFGRINTVLDFVFTRPYERLRITSASRIVNLPRTGNLARLLHAAVGIAAPHATEATLSGATLALQSGADSGEYVFDDLKQFDHYCRWVYHWRLNRRDQSTDPENANEIETADDSGDES